MGIWDKVKPHIGAQFLDVIDPRMLLVTDRQLQHSRDLIERFRNRPGSQPTASGAENAELWRAKKMMCVHTHLPTPPAPPPPMPPAPGFDSDQDPPPPPPP